MKPLVRDVVRDVVRDALLMRRVPPQWFEAPGGRVEGLRSNTSGALRGVREFPPQLAVQ